MASVVEVVVVVVVLVVDVVVVLRSLSKGARLRSFHRLGGFLLLLTDISVVVGGTGVVSKT